MSQNTPTPPAPQKSNDFVTTYGPLILSGLIIIFVAIAFFARYIDWQAAIDVLGIILGANGLYIATKWQAAPQIIAQIQSIVGQLMSHIQELHAQQNQSKVTSAYVPPPAPSASPIPPRSSRPQGPGSTAS